MRTKKTVQVPATTRSEIDKTVCDLCGAETEGENLAESTWHFNDTDITIQASLNHRESYEYDSGESEEIKVDLCPDCFKNKLVPWLNSQGANIKTERFYW